MPKFNVTVPHSCSKEDASAKIRLLLDSLCARYGSKINDLEQSFEDNRLTFSFKTLGMKVSGQGIVDDQQVDIQGDLPLAAMMVKGQIESSIRDQLTRLLQGSK